MVGRISEGDVFQKRLNELFSRSDRRLTNRNVVEGMHKLGYTISAAYLSQLRSGARRNPSDEVVETLAMHFGVPVGYFYTKPWRSRRDRMAAQHRDAVTIEGITDPALKHFLLSVNGLSQSSLTLLLSMADKLTAADRIPPGVDRFI